MAGNIKASGLILPNNAASGRVLISDANGLATWVDANTLGGNQTLQQVTANGNVTSNVIRVTGEDNVGTSGGGELVLVGPYSTPKINDTRCFIGWKNSMNTLTDGLAGTLLLQSRTSTENASEDFPIDLITGKGTPQLRMRIKGDGNVGIGTGIPAERLQVIGNAIIGQNNNSGQNAKLEITSGGGQGNSVIDFGYYNTYDANIWNVGRWGVDGSFRISDMSSGRRSKPIINFNEWEYRY